MMFFTKISEMTWSQLLFWTSVYFTQGCLENQKMFNCNSSEIAREFCLWWYVSKRDAIEMQPIYKSKLVRKYWQKMSYYGILLRQLYCLLESIPCSNNWSRQLIWTIYPLQEPNNLLNLNSFRYNGLVHRRSIGITPADKNGFTVTYKKSRAHVSDFCCWTP